MTNLAACHMYISFPYQFAAGLKAAEPRSGSPGHTASGIHPKCTSWAEASENLDPSFRATVQPGAGPPTSDGAVMGRKRASDLG